MQMILFLIICLKHNPNQIILAVLTVSTDIVCQTVSIHLAVMNLYLCYTDFFVLHTLIQYQTMSGALVPHKAHKIRG